MQCGHTTASWPAFRRAVLLLRANRDQSTIAKRRLFDIVVSRLCQVQTGVSFARLLNAVWYLQCSNPRDMIYGILGMMSSKFVAAIHVQYSALVGDVFKDAVLTHIGHVQCLETIHLCDITRQRSDVPSWVPSFGNTGRASLTRRFEHYSSGFSRAHVLYTPPGALRVYGVMIAEVQSVDEIGWVEKDDCVLIDLSKQPDGLFTTKYVSGGSLLDAYLSTLLVGRLRDRYPSLSQCPPIRDWANTYTSAMPQPERTLSKRRQRYIFSKITRALTVEKARNMKLPLNIFSSDAALFQIGRGLIRLETGHIGLGPLSARPGQFRPQQRSWSLLVMAFD